MNSSITAHTYAQMQHAEYEAQASRMPYMQTKTAGNQLGIILGKVAALMRQVQEEMMSRTYGEPAVEN